MKKRVWIAYITTIIVLSLMIAVGVISFFELYAKYGWSYQTTTIVQNVETTETIHLMNNVIALFFISWITFLLTYLITQKQENKSLFT